MKRLIGLLFLVLIFGAACARLPTQSENNERDEEIPISVDDAVEKGFPVYLPSGDILQSMDIAVSPTVLVNTQDNTCSYLLIEYHYVDKELETPAMSMQVSDGCMATFWRGYAVELSRADGGTATLVEEDRVTPIVIFNEPVQRFQYVVFSQEPLSNTLKLLESME